MQVDTFEPVSPCRAHVFHGDEQLLAVIVDGVGSWGSGREAADRTRKALTVRWQDSRGWSADSLADDISSVASSTPNDLRDPEFGWSFSVTCLLVTEDRVDCIAAGAYRVDVCGPSGMKTLFRPETLVDQLLARGELTPETAETFPHAHICMGPFVGDRDEVVLTRAHHTVAPDEMVVVTHALRYDLARVRVPQSAREFASLARPGAYPSPVVIVRP